MSSTRRESCRTCRWVEFDESAHAEADARHRLDRCRRNPPQHFEDASWWPQVHLDKDWCGEWEKRPKPPTMFGKK